MGQTRSPSPHTCQTTVPSSPGPACSRGSRPLLGAGLMLSGKEEGAIVGWSMLWIPESPREASAAGRCPSPCRCCLTRCACSSTCSCSCPCMPGAATSLRFSGSWGWEKDRLESWQWRCTSLLTGQWRLGMLFTRLGLGWAELLAAAGTQLDLLLHWLCPSGRPSLKKG